MSVLIKDFLLESNKNIRIMEIVQHSAELQTAVLAHVCLTHSICAAMLIGKDGVARLHAGQMCSCS